MTRRFFAVLLAAALALAPSPLWACACGCGVFDVSTSALLPTKPGGIVYLEYDALNQNKNWGGNKRASDGDNADKQIRTNFFTAGVQYMFNRSWGVMAEVPYWNRLFKTTDDNGNVADSIHSAVGDIRARGVYSGFSDDMSSGVTFGLKLPTGDFTYPNFDRDTQIGTGSTDLLLGAYRIGRFGETDWNWFSNVQGDKPLLTAGGYRPGAELDAVGGIYYAGWRPRGVLVAPTAHVVGAQRWRDSGPRSNSNDSGYRRVFLSPGLEVMAGSVRIYGDVGFPVYQFVNGNQLVASEQFKLNVGYVF
jgi:hypothetical protein